MKVNVIYCFLCTWFGSCNAIVPIHIFKRSVCTLHTNGYTHPMFRDLALSICVDNHSVVSFRLLKRIQVSAKPSSPLISHQGNYRLMSCHAILPSACTWRLWICTILHTMTTRSIHRQPTNSKHKTVVRKWKLWVLHFCWSVRFTTGQRVIGAVSNDMPLANTIRYRK